MQTVRDLAAEYAAQGFVCVEGLLTPEECDELNGHSEGVVRGRVKLGPGAGVWMEDAAVQRGLVDDGRPDPAYLFKIGHQMHWHDPVYRYYAMHERILDVLERLVGPDLKCVQTMYIDKPRNLGVGQPYHQDSHYLKTEPDTLVAAWIACDDVDEANGCLHVVPGSQHDPLHPHQEPLDPAQRRYFVEVHAARQRREVACPLHKGGAVFFPGRLLHRSGNNLTSDRQRRAFVVHYCSSRSRWLNDPKARNPHLLVRGRQYAGCV